MTEETQKKRKLLDHESTETLTSQVRCLLHKFFVSGELCRIIVLDCSFVAKPCTQSWVKSLPELLRYISVSSFQIELDKAAEEFRKAHAERQELIAQWEHTIEQMQKRDCDMDLLAAVSI